MTDTSTEAAMTNTCQHLTQQNKQKRQKRVAVAQQNNINIRDTKTQKEY